MGALAQAGVATFAGAVLFDEWKVAYLRRDDQAYIPQPGDVRALVCAVMYGYEDEVKPGGKRLFRIAKDHGARYLGDEISEGTGPPARYATPCGRTKAGQVVPMSWHCEDAAINRNLPAVTKAWHEIVADLRRRTDVFDDWGMFAYTSGSTGVDYLTEIDVGIWEQLDDGPGRCGSRPSATSPPWRWRLRLDQRVPRLVPRGRGRPGARRARPLGTA